MRAGRNTTVGYPVAEGFGLLRTMCTVVVSLAGCTTYHARPLPPSDAIGTRPEQDLGAIEIPASEIEHPLLRPLVVRVEDGLTPDEAALLAVAANPELRAARAARGVAAAQLVAAGILPNPVLSASEDVPVSDTTGAVTGVSLGAALDILGFLTRGAEKEAGRRGVESVDLGLAWQEWQVAQSARIETYYAMLLDRAVRLARSQEQQMSQSVSTLEDAVSRQLATRVELGAAEVAYRTTVDARLTLELQRDTAAVSLARMLGVDRTALPELQDVGIPFDTDSADTGGAGLPTLDALVAGLGARRLDLQGLRTGYLSQEARVRAAVLRQFPQIGIGVNRIRDTGNLLTLGPAVTMSFPLFDRNQGEIAVTRATRDVLRAEYDARVIGARATIEALLLQVTVTRQRLANLRAGVAAQERTVELYNRALQSGNADVLTYYNARSDLMNRRLEAVAALRDLVGLAIALETESGVHFVGTIP